MARPLKPFIRGGGFYPSRRWTPLVYPGGYTTANGGGEPEPPPIEKTIIGNPIHITDALAKPVQALSIALEPIQDLNGYSYPWPAGGGKNLLWLNNGVFKTGGFRENRQLTGIGTWVGMSASNYLAPNNIVSYTIGDNNLTVEAKSNGYGIGIECKLTAGQQYTLSWVGTNVYVGISFYDGDGAQLSYVTSGASPKTFTVPESTANAIIVLRADNANVTGEFSNVQLEEGQTATTYAPYSNICPISGYNNVVVKKAQRNIWAFDASYNPAGYAVLVPRNTECYLPAGTYTFSAIPDIESSSVVLGGYYADDTQVTLARLNASEERQSATFTIAKPLYKMYLIANKGGTISDIQLELGSTATAYEPYSGDTYSITFPSEAGTVYGGTLDVTTGKLTVDRAMVDLGTLTWYAAIAQRLTRFRAPVIGIKQIGSPNVLGAIVCSSYATKTANQTYTGSIGISLQQNANDVYIYDPQKETFSAADFKSAMSGVQLVYELATPIVYDLTPMQIELFTGENNIWSDGEMTLTYLADGNASDEEALGILLGNRYVNNHGADEPTDSEALGILLGGNGR